MPSLRLRFHGDLNDFLPRPRREQSFEVSFDGRPAIKDLIEAAGVPHVEVDRIVASGGASLDFSSPAQEGIEVEVYGFEEHIAPGLLPMPLPEPRFVLDGHLGRLAAMLRMLGFDVIWSAQADDADLARISAEEDRILLTRDVGLLKRSIVRRGRFVRATDPNEQVCEVARRFSLSEHLRPFTRCLRDNTPLRTVEKSAVEHRLPPRVREAQTEFRECPTCHRLYWPGTHHARMSRILTELGRVAPENHPPRC